MFGIDGGDTRGTHDKVAFREDVVCPRDGEGGHDFADKRVERGVQTEDFADDVVEKDEVFEVVVLQWSIADDAFLLFIEFFTELDAVCGGGTCIRALRRDGALSMQRLPWMCVVQPSRGQSSCARLLYPS